MEFRCATASADAGESLAGTAPTDTDWLLVEHAGPWGRKAVTESRLPQGVVDHLESRAGVRVQLVRRHGGTSGPGVRVFTVALAGTPTIRSAVLPDLRDLPELAEADLAPYDGSLWLVCTNGRRDRCCAEAGRPIAAALAGRWPEETWETTHLGGHRFAGTLLGLPSGVALGRLNAQEAMTACDRLAAGEVPLAVTRGRAGLPGRAQYAEVHVRTERGLTGLADVAVLGLDGDLVTLRTPSGEVSVRVEETAGEPRRQSCADLKTKPAPVFRVVG